MHPYGNPHYMLDPVLAKTAITNIYNALVATAPQYQADFTRNRDAYLAKLDAKIAEWEQEAKTIKGMQFVSYHEHWPYFAERFGLKYIGTIELKPGIDPTPRHIEATGEGDEGRPRPGGGSGTAVPGEGAQAHRPGDRRHPGETAHHARGRAQHEHLYRR